MYNRKGFFESLFDFSFNYFVTNKIIPVLYALSLIGIILWAVLLTAAAFTAGSYANNAAIGILVLFFIVPVFIVFATIYVRVGLEFLIVVFRIADHVRDIAATGGLAPAANQPGWNPQQPASPVANSNHAVAPVYVNVSAPQAAAPAPSPFASPPPPPAAPALPPSQQPPTSGWRTLG